MQLQRRDALSLLQSCRDDALTHDRVTTVVALDHVIARLVVVAAAAGDATEPAS